MDALSTDALAALEWQAIREMVRERTATAVGADQAVELLPHGDLETVRQEQQLTVESVTLLRAGDALPFQSLKDLRSHLQRLEVERVRLEGLELYDLCLLLRNAEDLRGFIAAQSGGEVEIPQLAELSATLPELSELRREVGEHLSPSGEVMDSASRSDTISLLMVTVVSGSTKWVRPVDERPCRMPGTGMGESVRMGRTNRPLRTVMYSSRRKTSEFDRSMTVSSSR